MGLRSMLKPRVAGTLCNLLDFVRFLGVDGLERRIARRCSVSLGRRARTARCRARQFDRHDRRRGGDLVGPTCYRYRARGDRDQTALNELGHWTGHPDRLNRPTLTKGIEECFASPHSAREELRAEIRSMMTGDRLRLGHDQSRHAAYVGSWIQALRDDPREIYRAAQDAQVMSDYVLDRNREKAPGRESEAAGREAAVAISTGVAELAEIAKQRLAPATGSLAQSQQCAEPLMLDPLCLLRPVGVVDHQAADPDIVHAVEHEGFRRQSVTPGLADLLIVGLDGRLDVGVDDKADVWLVNAHTEGNSCHHDDAVFGQNSVLVPVPDDLVHSGVIGQCCALGRRQALRRPLRFLAREGVDDPGPPRVSVQQSIDLPRRGIPGGYADLQVWTVEAGDENLRPTAEQPFDDVLPRNGIGRCREGAEAGVWKMLRQFGEASVVWPEVVAPL